MNPLPFILSNGWRTAALVALACLAVQTIRLDGANADKATLRAELALCEAASERMVEEGRERRKAGQEAVSEARKASGVLTRQAGQIAGERPVAAPEHCETPPAIFGADL